jgi:transcriptional regulator with XRE-family HTH domain
MSRKKAYPVLASTATPKECVEILIDAGWSQADISKVLKCQRTTVCRILSGQTPGPDYRLVDALRAMVLYLGRFPNTFLPVDPSHTPSP